MFSAARDGLFVLIVAI